jgi:hypothetical protein
LKQGTLGTSGTWNKGHLKQRTLQTRDTSNKGHLKQGTLGTKPFTTDITVSGDDGTTYDDVKIQKPLVPSNWTPTKAQQGK